MSDTDELAGWLRLTLCDGVGPASQRALLAEFGLPEQIFVASRQALTAVVGAGKAAKLLITPDISHIEAALAWSRMPGNHILTLADSDYPRTLLDISDPPTLLYVKGDPALLEKPALAIVGSRSPTPQGVANAEAFARSLAETGLVIISGLAMGIDAAAHRGALGGGGATAAVIGTGANRVYPADNRTLAHQIAESGVIISEFPLDTPPRAHNFPRRNRLIAGLSRGVLVTEASIDSGSLITARLAAEYGREVFAIPGSIHSPLSRGCHRLIRDGAKLVETANDILDELHWNTPLPRFDGNRARPAGKHHMPAEKAVCSTAFSASTSVNKEEGSENSRVLEAMGYDATDLDTLANRCGLTLDALYAILLPLELDGFICRLPGGRFQRL